MSEVSKSCYCTEHDWFEMKLSSLVLSRACLFGID
ncbi:hypothetical protein SLEP1_g39810 [Rubroshorea leprosula]|uniref:Uncharacterized protein n=1 Tax=Rubroshorea leprosula TaxID=152421 RepID=A0AAV5L1R7_9ROSI|nr:hypothetical protein SLEP1_g39810 [Rubroshorea leprosula]